MTVISLSIEEKLLNELDKLKEDLGYSGRSEIVRSAIRTFIGEKSDLEKLEGEVNCILTITHTDESLNVISDIQHDYQNVVKTQIHDHLRDHKCLQMYLLEGNSEKIKMFWKDLQSCKKVEKVNFNPL